MEKLRNTKNVSDEIQQICQEARDSTSNEAISLKQLFLIKELRWPLFTGILLQIAQQLCGINAVSCKCMSLKNRKTILTKKNFSNK